MIIAELEFIEGVRVPGARPGSGSTVTKWRAGAGGTARLFGPGVAVETEQEPLATIVPWSNIKWLAVDKEAMPAGAKR